MDAEKEKTGHEVETSAPVTNGEGFVMHGEFPLNRRMRAEAMARAGHNTDAEGLIDDDLIATTRERLAVEDAEQEAIERAKPSMRWTRDQLLAHATGPDLGLTIETDANKETILAAIEAAPAKGA